MSNPDVEGALLVDGLRRRDLVVTKVSKEGEKEGQVVVGCW